MEMRRDFIPNASHELKTPITVIKGFAEALQDNPKLPQETQKEVTSEIVRNCNRMTALIKDLLELAIFNLIEHAAKYSNRPAEIQIQIDETTSDVVIEISDKGIGIPKTDQEHIFERFYTVAKAHSQKMGGSGLGLSIVKTIDEKHFGTIELRSQAGQGSTFTIQIPKRDPENI